jgi:flagellar protein FliT
MMAQIELLAHYESIAASASLMLAAARESRWDDLVEAERDCAARIANLKALCEVPELDEQGRKRKFDILHTVLEHDAEIRRLTQPWMGKLEAFLSGAVAARKVSGAYR